MLAFILRRVVQSAAVMGVVAFIAFGLFNFTGDPVAFMVGPDATLADRTRLRADLGLDAPFYVPFARFADVPVMAAYLCFIALIFVAINLVVDLLYYAADPRLRLERVAVA